MGAEPGEAYVWLGRPDWLDEAGTLALCDGIAELAARAGVAVLGGDLTASPTLAVSVTVVGHGAEPGAFVGRGGAERGDAVCVTGALGGAAAGLMLLEQPDLEAELTPELGASLRARQLAPEPRLAAGRGLAGAGAGAMIDISDGLGADAEQLAAASGCEIEIEIERVPLAEGVADLAAAAGRERHELALGGEDYELLCAVPRDRVEEAAAVAIAAGVRLTEVGRFWGDSGVVRLRLPGGRSIPSGGHDHVRR
jgi:thiamine-monophosphate kinase